MKIELISNDQYLNYLLIKHKQHISCYDNFINSILNEHENNIINYSEKFNIDIKPYLFTFSLQNKNEIKAFIKYYITYLMKANIINNYTQDITSLANMYKFISQDIEFLITCISCMQYYFI
jgi:hypothetical protein